MMLVAFNHNIGWPWSEGGSDSDDADDGEMALSYPTTLPDL